MLEVFARQSKPEVRNIGYSGERLLNLFLRPSDGVSQAVIMGRSGLVEVVDLGAPVRAIVQRGGAVFAVAGDTVYRVGQDVAINVGTVSAIGDVYMAESGDEIAIVCDDKYYICDGTTTVEYSTGAITKPKCVTYQDGYFVVTGRSAGRGDALTVSALDDGTTFDNLDFAFAENSPDIIRSCISNHGELWLLGTKTVEVFYNSGNADFPFTRNSGALMEHGCLHGKTVAKEDNSVFWVRPDGAVVRASGGTPQVISTPEIQDAIATSSIIGGFAFADRGHKFYAVTRAGETTLVYDIVTGLWHERSTGTSYDKWMCDCVENTGGNEFFGTDTGKVVKHDAGVFTDDGAEIMAEAVSIPVDQADAYFAVGKLSARIFCGAVDIGRTPKVALQTSRNGRDWSNEKWRDLGNIGEYTRNVTWHGLGTFQRGQFRLRITDPVARDIYGVTFG